MQTIRLFQNRKKQQIKDRFSTSFTFIHFPFIHIKILHINGRIYDRIISVNTLICYFLNPSHFIVYLLLQISIFL